MHNDQKGRYSGDAHMLLSKADIPICHDPARFHRWSLLLPWLPNENIDRHIHLHYYEELDARRQQAVKGVIRMISLSALFR